MADADVIAAAGSALEDKVLALVSFVDVCRRLDEASEHQWVYVLGGVVHALDEAVQTYVTSVNRLAMPYLSDLAATTRPNGGMGAMAPMATLEVDRQ